MTDQRIEKWTRWIEGPIKNEVLAIHLRRHAWQEIGDLIDRNGGLPPSYFWEFFRELYGHTQAVAVRRLADTHRDAGSLGKLIEEVHGAASLLTRDFWIGLWDLADGDTMHAKLDRKMAERGWERQFGGDVGDHLDPAIPQRDLERLRQSADKVKAYVDEHIAHLDAKPRPAELTIGEIHEVIEPIGELFGRYANLFTAASWAMLTPAIQDDWLAPFRVPWIRPTDRYGTDPNGVAERVWVAVGALAGSSQPIQSRVASAGRALAEVRSHEFMEPEARRRFTAITEQLLAARDRAGIDVNGVEAGFPALSDEQAERIAQAILELAAMYRSSHA